MAPRLRDLIAKLKESSVADTDLHRFVTSFDPESEVLPDEVVPEVQQVKSDIIAHAASAMVAQATLHRQSVLALLSGAGAAAPN